MASALVPASGLVDASGRLVSADALLAQLQEEAGAGIGAALAVPQLAAIARLVQKLGVAVSRQALAGTREADLDLWVRAEPEDGAVRLVIEQCVERPVQPARWPDRSAEEVVEEAGDWFEIDPQLRLIGLAPALVRRFGTAAEPGLGLPLTRMLRLETDDDGNLPLLAAVATRSSFDSQRARLQSDPDVMLLVSGEPVAGPDGSFGGFRGQIRQEGGDDVWEEQAPAFDELLREPLDTIISEAEQIAERSDGPLRSDYAAYASDIAAAGRHLLEVLRSMGTEPLEEHDRIDLGKLTADAIALVAPQASERGVSLRQEGATDVRARGQARAVTQILVNLIGNATRFSPAGESVIVTVEPGEMARVTVADQGPGVATADRERIFERFEQAEPRGEGSGLGLAISRRLARSLGGDISLDSSEGEGARFTLSLPLN